MPEQAATQTLKLAVLCLLVLQNASVVIMGRYSQGVLKEQYKGSTVVIATEILKILISVVCISRGMDQSHLNSKPWSLGTKVWWLIQNSGYTWVPATCYFVQNTLQYPALHNLSSAVYAVMAQMKILTAAVFSYFLLRKKLSYRKWRALILLVVGGTLMENHTFEMHETNVANSENTNASDPITGTICIVSIVLLSGLAGVVAQLLLQNRTTHTNGGDAPPQMSLWDRNLQMAFWSIVFGFITLFWDREEVMENGGFFGGWTINTWILVFLWGIGGILVAITIKYTDVIIKGFASAISLILISIAGFALLGDDLDLIFGLGAMITIIATFNYNEEEPKNAILATNDGSNGNDNNKNVLLMNDNDMISNDNLKDGIRTPSNTKMDLLGLKSQSSIDQNDSNTIELVNSMNNSNNNNMKNNINVSKQLTSSAETDEQVAEQRPLLRNTDD